MFQATLFSYSGGQLY